MSQLHQPAAVNDYLTVKRAAAVLGVSPDTLRNWDRSKKLQPLRHPLNGYRLYRLADLEAFLHRIALGTETRSPRGRRPGKTLNGQHRGLLKGCE